MIAKVKTHLLSLYLSIVSSIAFYPTILALGLLMFAFLLLSLEDAKMTEFLLEKAPSLVINNADTARAILATLIGGIISLTVFSFSMVMVLLNQASSNFSPRLLPGLISDKRNQVVLGFYIGTILYNIIVLISILPSGDSYTIQGFSILIGIVLGILCLALFVFFIHSISTGIQINNILEKIYETAKTRLEYLIGQELEGDSIDAANAFANTSLVTGNDSGYFQNLNIAELKNISEDLELNIKILTSKGEYMLPGQPIFQIDKEITEDQEKQFQDLVIYSSRRDLSEDYLMGIKQIVEVGIKAMSPGINDPGTALMTLDYITELLALRMQLADIELYESNDSPFIIQFNRFSFKELIYYIVASFRLYCKHDMLLMEKIVLMLQYLQNQKAYSIDYSEILKLQLKVVIQDIRQSISNDHDKKRLLNLAEV